MDGFDEAHIEGDELVEQLLSEVLRMEQLLQLQQLVDLLVPEGLLEHTRLYIPTDNINPCHRQHHSMPDSNRCVYLIRAFILPPK